MIDTVVLFGPSGDLAGRHLLPALAELCAAGCLPDDFSLIGAGRQSWGDAQFRRMSAGRLAEHAPNVPSAAREALVASLRYRQVDLGDAGRLAGVVGGAGPVAAYLALPPGVFGAAVSALGGAGLPAGSRIVVEKPFGEDLDSAKALNRVLAQVVDEQGVFRVDHFLSITTVQYLLGARLANRILEPVWNSTHVAEVDIVWEETSAWVRGTCAIGRWMCCGRSARLAPRMPQPGPAGHGMAPAPSRTILFRRMPMRMGVDPGRGTATLAEMADRPISSCRQPSDAVLLVVGSVVAAVARCHHNLLLTGEMSQTGLLPFTVGDGRCWQAGSGQSS